MKCVHLQSADEALAHERVIATLEVSRPTFDWFFNSERDYRGSATFWSTKGRLEIRIADVPETERVPNAQA